MERLIRMIQSISLSLVLLGVFSVAAEDPFFRTQPTDTTIDEGQTAVLRCKVSGISGIHYVQWVKEGIAITFPNRTTNNDRLRNICQVGEPSRYSVDGDFAHGEFNLKIVHTLSAEDSDSYRCLVFDDFGPVLFSSDAQLTVRTQSAANYPVCLPTTIRNAYVAGDVLHTECLFRNANPLPELTWARNNRYISRGELIYPTLADKKRDWELTAEDDGAVITCQATGPAISSSQTCVIGPLVVYYAPTVTIVPEIADVSVHDSVMFTCSVAANPKPDAYFWQTNGNPIDLATGKYTISPNGKDLTISRLTIFDDGMVVTCIAGNIIGQSSASAVLYVLEAPPRPSTQQTVIVTDAPEPEVRETTTAAPPLPPIRPNPRLPTTTATKTNTPSNADPDSDLVFAGNSDEPREVNNGLALSVPVLAAVVTGSAIFAIVLVVLVCELTRWNRKRRKARQEAEEQRVTGYYDVNLSTAHAEDECKQRVNEWLKKSIDDKYYFIDTEQSLTIKLSRAGSTGQVSNLSSLESGVNKDQVDVTNDTQHRARDSVASNVQRHHYDEIANYTERGETFTDGTDSGVSGHVYSIPIDANFAPGKEYYHHHQTVISPSKLVNYGVIDTHR